MEVSGGMELEQCELKGGVLWIVSTTMWGDGR